LFETTFESLEEKTFFILFIEDEHKETHQKTRTRTDADMFLKTTTLASAVYKNNIFFSL